MWMFIGLVSFLAMIVFLIIGLISTFRKNGKAKKRFIYAAAFLVILIVAISLDDSEPVSTTASSDNQQTVDNSKQSSDKKDDSSNVKKQDNKQSTTPKKDNKPKPKPTIDKADINSAEFISLVKDVNHSIDKVAVSNSNVNITMDSDQAYWNESQMVEVTATDSVKIMEKVFSNPSVQSVTVNVPTSMMDDKGNETIENVINVTWNRELSNQVNYDNFLGMVYTDCTKFYNLAESYRIHPGIYMHIKNEYKQNMSFAK